MPFIRMGIKEFVKDLEEMKEKTQWESITEEGKSF
jgi:hypothetical protein